MTPMVVYAGLLVLCAICVKTPKPKKKDPEQQKGSYVVVTKFTDE